MNEPWIFRGPQFIAALMKWANSKQGRTEMNRVSGSVDLDSKLREFERVVSSIGKLPAGPKRASFILSLMSN